MSSVAKYLIDNHSKLARVLFPTSLAVGFAYTTVYGTTPLADAHATLTGQQGEAAPIWRTSASWPSHWP